MTRLVSAAMYLLPMLEEAAEHVLGQLAGPGSRGGSTGKSSIEGGTQQATGLRPEQQHVYENLQRMASCVQVTLRRLVAATSAQQKQQRPGVQAEFMNAVCESGFVANALGTLLEDFWALPEQAEAARLEVAQAAAARSCAHLRCPNVGLEGGPAAGQGRHCRQCSGCRVARYCGEGRGLVGVAVVRGVQGWGGRFKGCNTGEATIAWALGGCALQAWVQVISANR